MAPTTGQTDPAYTVTSDSTTPDHRAQWRRTAGRKNILKP